MMGYMHHSRYLVVFESARTELLRTSGMSYKQMEDSGIMLPLRRSEIDYRVPGKYDDILSVSVQIVNLSRTRLDFQYSVTNQDDIDVAEAQTFHVFVNKEGRPVRIDPSLMQHLESLA